VHFVGLHSKGRLSNIRLGGRELTVSNTLVYDTALKSAKVHVPGAYPRGVTSIVLPQILDLGVID